jgi:GntR family transcriptional regulator
MPLAHQTAYGQIADALRAEILDGRYEATEQDPDRHELPGAAELGARYGVSDKTAGRAIQQLIAEGLARGRPGQRPVAIPRAERPDRWQMQGRYARARKAGGLVFGDDMQGREVDKRTVRTGWIGVPDRSASLLRMNPGDRVWERARETLVDGRVAELSASYFPASIAEGTDLTTPGAFPPGGVVKVLEAAGYRIVRTLNEVRARMATGDELARFDADPQLAPLHGSVVIEITHATYGEQGEPLEAVVSVRPANDNVIVFETAEDSTP